MATVFWNSHGIILIDYLQKGKTITGSYYASLLDKLKAELAEKRPHLQKKKILFHQDHAQSHTSAVATAKIHELCDEAHFWLNGYVNKQNCRIWSEVYPQVYVETPLHPEKLTIWCALWAGGILLQKRRRLQRYSQW
ncbi:histone-lysine N-methyltransferase SETMAR [Trichonephila clavipes]|nr:histone-lysine N-methyltransferase SETMAR [Trichonephila clavipes]